MRSFTVATLACAAAASELSASCLQTATRYSGDDVSVFKDVDSAAVCQQLCRQAEACQFFSFDHGECSLKSSQGDSTSSEGVVSGPAYCPCLEDETVFEGLTIKTSNVSTSYGYSMCESMCQRRDGCTHWSYDTAKGKCHMKDIARGDLVRQTNADFVSGFKYCGPTCLQEATGIADYDQIGANHNNVNPFECQKRCQESADCTLFYYNTLLGQCKLLRSATLSPGRHGFSVGDKYCQGDYACDLDGIPFSCSGDCHCNTTLEPVDPSDCLAENADYYGHDIVGLTGVTTIDVCRAACHHTDGCRFFTFKADYEIPCWLKSSASGRRPLEGAYSGSVPCGSEPTRPAALETAPPFATDDIEKLYECYLSDTALVGNDIRGLSAPMTSEECLAACLQDGNCSSFTFNTAYRVPCWLKGGMPGRRHEAGATSGFATCSV